MVSEKRFRELKTAYGFLFPADLTETQHRKLAAIYHAGLDACFGLNNLGAATEFIRNHPKKASEFLRLANHQFEKTGGADPAAASLDAQIAWDHLSLVHHAYPKLGTDFFRLAHAALNHGLYPGKLLNLTYRIIHLEKREPKKVFDAIWKAFEEGDDPLEKLGEMG